MSCLNCAADMDALPNSGAHISAASRYLSSLSWVTKAFISNDKQQLVISAFISSDKCLHYILSLTNTVAGLLAPLGAFLSTKRLCLDSGTWRSLQQGTIIQTVLPTLAFFDTIKPTHLCTDASRQPGIHPTAEKRWQMGPHLGRILIPHRFRVTILLFHKLWWYHSSVLVFLNILSMFVEVLDVNTLLTTADYGCVLCYGLSWSVVFVTFGKHLKIREGIVWQGVWCMALCTYDPLCNEVVDQGTG